MWWLVATLVLLVLMALVAWARARARPDLRARSLPTEIGKSQGDVGMYGGGFRGDHGPTPGGGGF